MLDLEEDSVEIRPLPLCVDLEKAQPLIPVDSEQSTIQSVAIPTEQLELPEDHLGSGT